MAPKIVDKEKRRREIIDAALKIFSEKGYEAASMSQIAKIVGIGKGTIYEYFESKEELILNVIRAWVESIGQETESQISEIDDPVERLRQFAHFSMSAFTPDKNMVRLFLSMIEIVLKDDGAQVYRELIHDTIQSVCGSIADIFREGVCKGVFRSDVSADADKIAINLLAYLDGIGIYYYVLRGQIDLKDQVDIYLDGLLKGLMAEEK